MILMNLNVNMMNVCFVLALLCLESCSKGSYWFGRLNNFANIILDFLLDKGVTKLFMTMNLALILIGLVRCFYVTILIIRVILDFLCCLNLNHLLSIDTMILLVFLFIYAIFL